MKFIKLFENFNKSEIEDICRKYEIENYTINPDGSIDVDGDVNLYYLKLTKLPLKFNKVFGDFSCSNNELTSLDGCPKEVGGDFYCNNNKLTSLDGSPKEVGGDFNCDNNELTSLDGCPKEVGGDFNCYNNKLTSLDGSPNYSGYFDCSNNKLTSLEGCPEVNGDFDVDDNPITPIVYLFDGVKIYLEYQETYNFLRKDCKIVKHLLIEAIKDFNEYYNKNKKLPEKIEGYTYI